MTSTEGPELGSGALVDAVLRHRASTASVEAGSNADTTAPLWRQFVDAQQAQEATGRPIDLVWDDYQQAAEGAALAAATEALLPEQVLQDQEKAREEAAWQAEKAEIDAEWAEADAAEAARVEQIRADAARLAAERTAAAEADRVQEEQDLASRDASVLADAEADIEQRKYEANEREAALDTHENDQDEYDRYMEREAEYFEQLDRERGADAETECDVTGDRPDTGRQLITPTAGTATPVKVSEVLAGAREADHDLALVEDAARTDNAQAREVWGHGFPSDLLESGAIPAAAVHSMREDLADLGHRNVIDPAAILDPVQISDEEVLDNINNTYDGGFAGGVAGFLYDWHAGQDEPVDGEAR